jgi:hypothetical protein
MEILLRNFSRHKAQTVTLVFDQDSKSNFSVPFSGISQRVAVTTDHTWLKFMKIRPFEDWGDIKF